jgi:hypothetical protein
MVGDKPRMAQNSRRTRSTSFWSAGARSDAERTTDGIFSDRPDT